MKILLINPPSFGAAKAPGFHALTTLPHIYAPPMGLMYLKSYLKRDSDFEVRMWNAQVPYPPGWDELALLCGQYQPGLVGITVMSLYWYDALEAARLVRKNLPSAHIVLGGPHVSLYPEESLTQPEIDSVVIGEGEQTLFELARRLSKKESLEGVNGVWYKQKGTVVRNSPGEIERNLDLLPFPDHSDFDPSQYVLLVDRLAPAVVILSSRSCPFQCTFCYELNKHYRARSPENVIEEILTFKGLGYRSIDFYDDVFNVTKSRAMAISKALLKSNVSMPWSCRCRVDPVDEEMVAAMAESGCKRISYGIESSDPQILAQVKKNITPEQTVKAVKLCRKYRIDTLGLFMIGFPGETLTQAENTVKFALDLDLDFFLLSILMPSPGSEIYQQAVLDPKFGGDYLREFSRNPTRDFKIKIRETAIPEKQLHHLMNRAFLKFYLRPRHLFKSILKLASFEDLKIKCKAALIIGCRILASSRPSKLKNPVC